MRVRKAAEGTKTLESLLVEEKEETLLDTGRLDGLR